MQNTAFNQLATYPFWRLNNLLENIPKPPNFDEIALQIGEPKIPPPKFVADIIAENARDWAKYPPHPKAQKAIGKLALHG